MQSLEGKVSPSTTCFHDKMMAEWEVRCLYCEGALGCCHMPCMGGCSQKSITKSIPPLWVQDPWVFYSSRFFLSISQPPGLRDLVYTEKSMHLHPSLPAAIDVSRELTLCQM